MLFGWCSALLLLIINVNSGLARPGPWTIFEFSQEWPASECALEEKCKKVPAVVNGWTIHGLWPTNKDNKDHVTYCNSSWHFNWNRVEGLEPELLARWPDLLDKNNSHRFWRDEWDKHGTCAISVPDTGNEYKYFKKALDLNFQLNLTSALEKANIVPSCKIPYKLCDIQQALKKQLNLPDMPNVAYDKERRTGHQLVQQVEICLQKNFQLDSCYTHKTQCQHEHVYIYPVHETCS